MNDPIHVKSLKSFTPNCTFKQFGNQATQASKRLIDIKVLDKWTRNTEPS
ncbi:MAG: hypothetical protein NT027_14540 [Proteobacteria bacterium]|nr:hypothetical protein [Pseudomonadota bacterium]